MLYLNNIRLNEKTLLKYAIQKAGDNDKIKLKSINKINGFGYFRMLKYYNSDI